VTGRAGRQHYCSVPRKYIVRISTGTQVTKPLTQPVFLLGDSRRMKAWYSKPIVRLDTTASYLVRLITHYFAFQLMIWSKLLEIVKSAGRENPRRFSDHAIHHRVRWSRVFRLVRKIAKSDYYRRHVCLSVSLSVCLLSAWNNSAPTGRIFMKFDIGFFFENVPSTFKFE